MDSLTIINIPVLTAVVYLALLIYKSIFCGKEKFIRLIPVIAAVLGSALAITEYYVADGLILADNLLSAILIGASSGLAATGTHQIFKQFKDCKEEKDENDDKEDKEEAE